MWCWPFTEKELNTNLVKQGQKGFICFRATVHFIVAILLYLNESLLSREDESSSWRHQNRRHWRRIY